MSKQVILTVGCSSCGKSTWTSQFLTEHPTWVQLERDQIRFELFTDGVRDWTAYKFNKTNENKVSEVYTDRLNGIISKGLNIVLSDTWLNDKYRKEMINKLESEGYSVEIKSDWEVIWETIRKRNTQRQGGLDESILWDQWLRYQKYIGKSDTYVPNEELPLTAIVDIDGTVASMQGIRKAYEWDKVIHDKPIRSVVDIVKGLDAVGYNIVFLSGRDGSCEDQTLAWLYDVFYDMNFILHMRAAKDSRKDYIVKKELFDNHIKDNYNVQLVIDDRKQVIELWEQLGIKVINVGKLYERF